ncbi:non-ribosomal peptide synthetase [Streptomyces griseus]|uniref:Non-ribosomal peptide synthetase n=2 Tax=Streptomyces TaxID=1883 RepID=A0ABU2W6D6_9ACTN|nr:non-ribosomal peptide synthetase [Streptomyces griseus]MDT0492864.1 non-ribosomal peptide synthetase [Streptomyces griseus]
MAFEAIPSIVGRTIELFPDRVAVETPDSRLSYAELDSRADGVAAALHRAGAGAGSVVAVLTDDRAELAAAMVGVLRLGAVLAPLDLSAPPLRLAAVLADARPTHALVGADGDRRADGPLDAVPDTVRVGLGAAKSAARDSYPASTAAPDDPSHLFHTSGSTGRPKGILGRLSSLDHYIRWQAALLGAGPDWRVGQLVSPGFDAVLRDVLLPLSVGGTLCAPPAGIRSDPAALARWIDRERITLIHCVPSVFRPLLTAAVTGGLGFASLRCVALSGERLPPADAARWFDRFGDRVTLLNLYGPTETTMTKTFHVVTRSDTDRASIPVGRPLPETEVLLLDEGGAPVPGGHVGEIHLRTPHLALGYHRQPEATARAFVPDRLREGAGGLLYRTGDFGRLLPDGALEFLGRRDHQVKVGGVRVELEEVESALRECPGVTEAAVVLGEPGDGPPLLHAFVEPAVGVDTDAVRALLAERLPAAAVPAGIVATDGIPRTISGKIDRAALRPPAPAAAPDEHAVGPRNATEQAVADIWSSVLPAPAVDVRRTFQQSGGGSLAVISVLSRIEEEFGVSLPLLTFLRNPTIEALAGVVEEALLDTASDDLLKD